MVTGKPTRLFYFCWHRKPVEVLTYSVTLLYKIQCGPGIKTKAESHAGMVSIFKPNIIGVGCLVFRLPAVTWSQSLYLSYWPLVTCHTLIPEPLHAQPTPVSRYPGNYHQDIHGCVPQISWSCDECRSRWHSRAVPWYLRFPRWISDAASRPRLAVTRPGTLKALLVNSMASSN